MPRRFEGRPKNDWRSAMPHDADDHAKCPAEDFLFPLRSRNGGRRFAVLLPTHQRQVFRLPSHGGIDPVASARVVEEDPLLYWPRIHFAIFPEMNRGLGEAIGLAAGIQPIHIGFTLLGAGLSVHDRS